MKVEIGEYYEVERNFKDNPQYTCIVRVIRETKIGYCVKVLRVINGTTFMDYVHSVDSCNFSSEYTTYKRKLSQSEVTLELLG